MGVKRLETISLGLGGMYKMSEMRCLLLEGKPPDRILAGPYLLMYITTVR